jgi:hypothetical protein
MLTKVTVMLYTCFDLWGLPFNQIFFERSKKLDLIPKSANQWVPG